MTDEQFGKWQIRERVRLVLESTIELLQEIDRYSAQVDKTLNDEAAEWLGRPPSVVALASGPEGQFELTNDPFEEYEIWRTTSFLPVITRYSLFVYSFAVFEDCLLRCSALLRTPGVSCGHKGADIANHKDCLSDCGAVPKTWTSELIDWCRMTEATKIRHAIVHNNGRLSPASDRFAKSKATIDRLGKVSNSLIGIDTQNQIILNPGSVGWISERAIGCLSALKKVV